jgi:thymidylate kinase
MDLRTLMRKNSSFNTPDITFLFDLPVEVAFERRRLDGATEVFDKNKGFQEEIRKNYLDLLKEFLNTKYGSIILIDANKPVEEVHKEIVRHYENFLTI